MIKSPWSEYYKTTMDKDPLETVVFAENKFKDIKSKYALDIGSGTGCDSLYLLEHGFNVKALDSDINAITILKDKTDKKFMGNVTFEHTLIQDYNIPLSSFDLINASFSLPFCNQTSFKKVWNNILKGLKPNGIFSGQLFGVNDSWADIPEMTFMTNEEVYDLLDGYTPEYYIEVDEEGTIADGSVKHWHLFNLVLRKISC